MRALGVLLCLGLLGCSGSEFSGEDEPSNAGTGGEVVAAGAGGSDAGRGGTEAAGKGGAGGSQVTAGSGGNAGEQTAGTGGAGSMAGQAGGGMGPTAGNGGASTTGGAGAGGETTAGAGSAAGAGSTGHGGAGSSGSASGSGGSAMAGTGGTEPSLDPQPAANCPGFVDYYVPVGTCIWFQGEWEVETPECDYVVPDERSGCGVVDAKSVPLVARVQPGEQFMEPKRFDLVDGACPKVCTAAN